jgi:quercetin dioxygenase-like cupin family protein
MRTSAAILLCFATIASAAVQTEKVRNDKVAVIDCRLRPGETQPLNSTQPGVTVYFQGGALEITPQGGKAQKVTVKPGDAVFRPAQAGVVKNTGASEIHFARVDFLGSGATETWGTTGLSPNYKVLIENPYTRVYDIRIPAGTREPQHTHKNRVVVCLSGAQMRHLMPDGREEPSTMQTGEIDWRLAATHIGENLGTTNLWVIAIEPK